MAIRYEKLKAGETYYERKRYRMGNTTIRTLGEWPVRIIELDPERRRATVSWNGNPPETWSERSLRRLYDWSMHGPEAQITTGFIGNVIKVKKLRLAERERSR